MDENQIEGAIQAESAALAATVRNAQAAVRPLENPVEDCEECGGEIPEARRRAAPHAVRCIDCQTEFERRR